MAPDPTPDDPVSLERAILGEDPVHSALEVAAETGVTIEELRRLWRALGFPEHGTEIAFNRADADAVSTLTSIVESGAIDFDMAVMLTRGVGQTMARLADWEVATLAHRVEELELGEEATGSRARSALRMVEEVNPQFEQLLIYAWRRHLAAAVARIEALAANEAGLNTTQLTVGFADIVVVHRAVQRGLARADRRHRGDLRVSLRRRGREPPRPRDQEPGRLGAVRARRPDLGVRHRRAGSSTSSAATRGCRRYGSAWPPAPS